MSEEYKYSFKQIIDNFYLFKLGTIIESECGDRYKLTKTDIDTRKFTRVNKGLRFMTYDNMDRLFKIVEEEPDIDIQSISELPDEEMRDDWRYYVPMFFYKINELVQAVKQLDKKIVNLQSNKEIQ